MDLYVHLVPDLGSLVLRKSDPFIRGPFILPSQH